MFWFSNTFHRQLWMAALLAVLPIRHATAALAHKPPYRYLFVIDTSETMSRHRSEIGRLLGQMIRSGFDGWASWNEAIGFWTYGQKVTRDALPVEFWTPSQRDRIAEQAERFMGAMRFGKTSRLDVVVDDLQRVAANSESISIFIISDGHERLRGTPFDASINDIYARLPRNVAAAPAVITRLTARDRAFCAWAVQLLNKPIEGFNFAEAAAAAAATHMATGASDPNLSPTNIPAIRQEMPASSVALKPSLTEKPLPPPPVLKKELLAPLAVAPLQFDDENFVRRARQIFAPVMVNHSNVTNTGDTGETNPPMVSSTGRKATTREAEEIHQTASVPNTGSSTNQAVVAGKSTDLEPINALSAQGPVQPTVKSTAAGTNSAQPKTAIVGEKINVKPARTAPVSLVDQSDSYAPMPTPAMTAAIPSHSTSPNSTPTPGHAAEPAEMRIAKVLTDLALSAAAAPETNSPAAPRQNSVETAARTPQHRVQQVNVPTQTTPTSERESANSSAAVLRHRPVSPLNTVLKTERPIAVVDQAQKRRGPFGPNSREPNQRAPSVPSRWGYRPTALYWVGAVVFLLLSGSSVWLYRRVARAPRPPSLISQGFNRQNS